MNTSVSTHSSSDLSSFISDFGRLPSLGDAQAPWHYRGWLLPYVLLIHERCPDVPDRWGYHLRTLEAGHLLDELIPQISFGAPDKKVFTAIEKWTSLIGRDGGGWADFRTLLDWLLWGLALGAEAPSLTEKASEALYRQVDLGPLLLHPYDYLGEFVAQRNANGWNPTGFFPTPHSVVECMVRMTFGNGASTDRDARTLKVCDPCVGSGRMLLHASNFSLSLWGQDIDPLAVAMCKINGALYAPWLSCPLPAAIFAGEVKRTTSLAPSPERQLSEPVPEGVLF